MGMFGRFREKVKLSDHALYSDGAPGRLGCGRFEDLLLTFTSRSLQAHELAPGHFNPTSSDRIDKMYKEVSS